MDSIENDPPAMPVEPVDLSQEEGDRCCSSEAAAASRPEGVPIVIAPLRSDDDPCEDDVRTHASPSPPRSAGEGE